MILDQHFTYTFSMEDVVCLRMFFRQGISKLGSGEFKDHMERLFKDFERELIKSEIKDKSNNPDIF